MARVQRLRALRAIHTPDYRCSRVLAPFGRAQFTLKKPALTLKLSRVAVDHTAVLSLEGGGPALTPARRRTLSALGSHGVRPIRIWSGLTSLRDSYGLLGGVPLCPCIPRAPSAPEPYSFHLCVRGAAEYSLLVLRARAIRITLTGLWGVCDVLVLRDSRRLCRSYAVLIRAVGRQNHEHVSVGVIAGCCLLVRVMVAVACFALGIGGIASILLAFST